MSAAGEMRVAGVAGWPIAHSLSPAMMNAWLKTTGLNASYVPLAIAPGQAQTVFRALAHTSLAGLNVTLPFKEDALAAADEISPAALAIGAANLLTFADGKITADNTDTLGFLEALAPANIDYPDINALVLGAGGAARALIHALRSKRCGRIFIANRSRERAENLAVELAPEAEIIAWDQRDEALASAGLIVNATSLGLKGENELEMDWSRAPAGGVVFDSVYTPIETGFLRGAKKAGLATIDGLDMLIGQARPSYEAFFGAPPPQTDMRARLLSLLEARA